MGLQQPISLTLTRARATRSAQFSVRDVWVWDEKTLATWDEDIAAVQAGQQAMHAAESEMLAKRGALDAVLDDLRQRTQQGLALAKVRYRNDAAKKTVIAKLSARGQSRTRTLAAADAWASAWAELDPAYAPTTTNTRDAFNALRAQCVLLENEYARARANVRSVAEALNRRAARLSEASKAWYAAATRIFPDDTAEGAMLRGTIPTTYSKDAEIGATVPSPTSTPPQG